MQENKKKYYLGAMTVNTSSASNVMNISVWRAGIVLTSEISNSDCEVKCNMQNK